jgi:enoyl-CoA hydratase/carnithine racemase
LTEIARGLGPSGARTNLARHMPFRAAMRMVLTAESIDAAEALRCGLVNEVLPKAEVFPRAFEWAEQIAKMPPLVVRSEKNFLKRSLDMPYRELMPFADMMGCFNQMSQDATEGVDAFLEKREPQFRGL